MRRRRSGERQRYQVGIYGDRSERWWVEEASEPREAVHRFCEAHGYELRERHPFGFKAWTDWGEPWEHFETWEVDVSSPPAWIIHRDKSEEEIRAGT